MLTDCESEHLEQRLREELATELMKVHAELHAQLVLLCARFDKQSIEEDPKISARNLRGHHKVITFDIELGVIEVMRALSRIQKRTYGLCTLCGRDMSFVELEDNPSRLLCSNCTDAVLSDEQN